MRRQVFEIIAKSTGLDIDNLEAMQSSNELWDSFTKVDIVLNLEAALNLEFSDEEMITMNSVSAILNVIQQKMS